MKGETMIGSGAIFADGFTVDGGGITLVLVPVILGEFFVDAKHEVVTIGFGKDTGGSNAHVGGVAFDDGGVGNVFVWRKTVAVDEQMLRANL